MHLEACRAVQAPVHRSIAALCVHVDCWPTGLLPMRCPAIPAPGRRNSINGRVYKDDPVILSWNLMNEVRSCCPWKESPAPFLPEAAPDSAPACLRLRMPGRPAVGWIRVGPLREGMLLIHCWLAQSGHPACDAQGHEPYLPTHLPVAAALQVLRAAACDRLVPRHGAAHEVGGPQPHGHYRRRRCTCVPGAMG